MKKQVKKVAAVEKVIEKTAEKAEKAPARVKKVKAISSVPLAHGVGRRKSACARVWLRRGKGLLKVNKKDVMVYFDTEPSRLAATLPFRVCETASNYDVVAEVSGGGIEAQADAVKLGISRALLLLNPDIRPLLRQHGLLTVDARLKERKKYGQKAARRRFQFVKR